MLCCTSSIAICGVLRVGGKDMKTERKRCIKMISLARNQEAVEQHTHTQAALWVTSLSALSVVEQFASFPHSNIHFYRRLIIWNWHMSPSGKCHLTGWMARGPKSATCPSCREQSAHPLPNTSGPSEGKSTADVASFLRRFVLTKTQRADADSFHSSVSLSQISLAFFSKLLGLFTSVTKLERS